MWSVDTSHVITCIAAAYLADDSWWDSLARSLGGTAAEGATSTSQFPSSCLSCPFLLGYRTFQTRMATTTGHAQGQESQLQTTNSSCMHLTRWNPGQFGFAECCFHFWVAIWENGFCRVQTQSFREEPSNFDIPARQPGTMPFSGPRESSTVLGTRFQSIDFRCSRFEYVDPEVVCNWSISDAPLN